MLSNKNWIRITTDNGKNYKQTQKLKVWKNYNETFKRKMCFAVIKNNDIVQKILMVLKPRWIF